MKLKFLHKTPTAFTTIFFPYCHESLDVVSAKQKLIKKKIYGVLKLKNTQ